MIETIHRLFSTLHRKDVDKIYKKRFEKSLNHHHNINIELACQSTFKKVCFSRFRRKCSWYLIFTTWVHVFGCREWLHCNIIFRCDIWLLFLIVPDSTTFQLCSVKIWWLQVEHLGNETLFLYRYMLCMYLCLFLLKCVFLLNFLVFGLLFIFCIR